MIKHTTLLIAAIVLCAVPLRAQQSVEVPFAALDKAVREEQGGWAGNKERLSKIFADERKRLGPDFENVLFKWLSYDRDKHYWASAFLDWEVYLHGNKRLPELSLLIKQQGLALVQNEDSEETRGYIIGVSITAAILSDELGLRPLAISYKAEAERLLRLNPSFASYIPALSDAERRRYDEIKVRVAGPPTISSVEPKGPRVVPVEVQPQQSAPLSGGVLNGRALRLPKPEYPSAAREAQASGPVEVRVLIDETGKVISARAISGHPELRKASEDAASRAEFTPTTLAGRAVKVTGSIIYNFVYRR
jgi:TonB family protein